MQKVLREKSVKQRGDNGILPLNTKPLIQTLKYAKSLNQDVVVEIVIETCRLLVEANPSWVVGVFVLPDNSCIVVMFDANFKGDILR